MKFKIFVAIIILVGLGGIIFAANRNADKPELGSKISASNELHDFGAISMKDGNVTYTTTIENTSDQPVTITKLHTSCMCTEVTMTVGEDKIGPFGMEGHGGTVPSISRELAPGQEARLEVEFDPAAHGAAGIGQIERSIFIDTSDAARAELEFKAMVSP